jgi:hypothetical protein
VFSLADLPTSALPISDLRLRSSADVALAFSTGLMYTRNCSEEKIEKQDAIVSAGEIKP